MSDTSDDSSGPELTDASTRHSLAYCILRALFGVVITAMLLFSNAGPAQAQSFRQGVSAFNRQDYQLASQIFIPLAERGEPPAQAYLGFMFETGRGVPQNY